MSADTDSGFTKLSSMRVRILATSDLHANLHPYNYYTDAPAAVGLACAGKLIADLRAGAENCLLLDNGDTLQGTPLGDFAASCALTPEHPHPMVAAMNALGYDGMTLGNHDFDYGLEFLEDALAGAAFPAVLANIRRSGGAPLLEPSTILERRFRDTSGKERAIRIGLVGVAPPQTLKWDARLLDGLLEAEDIVDAARREVARLRDEGADLVIVLSHSGLGPAEERPLMENAALPLAAIPGVDALIVGHTHEVFPGPRAAGAAALDPDRGTAHGTPTVQPGFDGSHLGMIDLDLSEIDTDRWRVTAAECRAVPVTGPGFTRILQATASDHRRTLDYVRQTIGRTDTALETYFALLMPSAAVQVVADAQRACARALLDGHPLAHLPLLSAAAPFKAGGRAGPGHYTDIAAGTLAIKNAADLYVYPNAIAVLQVTGAQIALWLERCACAFHRIEPGQPDQPLIDHAFAGYNFDVLDGLTYAIDVTVPARFSADGEEERPTPGRIRDLRHDGRPVQAGDRFLVATNSYRASGGGHFAVAAAAARVIAEAVPVRDAVIRHIAATDCLRPVPAPTWRFAPAGGIRAVAEIGPGALAYPDRVAAAGLRHIGSAPGGFARFAITI